jgi:hypothetical protein
LRKGEITSARDIIFTPRAYNIYCRACVFSNSNFVGRKVVSQKDHGWKISKPFQRCPINTSGDIP